MESSVANRNKPLAAKVVEFLSGYALACILMLLLLVLTWLGTLEQVDRGLFVTVKKYFSYETFFLFPEIKGKLVPLPLPSAFWVGAVFFVNLALGTILRVRKGWKTIGVLIAHGGMLFLLLGAFVTQVFSERGNMAITEGEVSNVAQHYFDHVIEVTEIADGKPAKVHVIATRHLEDLQPDDERLFKMANLPFDLAVSGYRVNARPVSVSQGARGPAEEVIDGFFLQAREPEVEAERNMPGAVVEVRAKDGTPGERFLLSTASFHPATLEIDGKLYALNLRKALWKMPFTVALDNFTHEFHPGTMRPKRFESEIRRIQDGREEPVLIKMNDPMRRQGFTFFQASWGPQNAAPGDTLFSVFEVVRNPADKWPEWSLYVTGVGLLVHFLMKLVLFITNQPKRRVRAS
ncbi:MAG: hypothetical protein HKN82_14540 [Akkermansiaceae bacterium]|nr:hypothetical protein [Akkermansiaceae bacterium]NNM29608.1 hypothetical protein [Akkermansiaceae bacterium]